MSSIDKVALAGATGNLGPAILDALVSAGFRVTVLTRQTTPPNLPSSVTVRQVDYTSLDSLTLALQGQDAVVSSLPSLASSFPNNGSTNNNEQLLLVEAAAKAGIKRFLPSEFGANTSSHEKTRSLPIFQPKVAVQDALKEQASSNPDGMSYTLIHTGLFLDWSFMIGFLMKTKEKSINLYNGGDGVFSTTTLGSIGKAVVGVLRNLDATKNRAVFVQDIATTLKDLLAKAKKATGGGSEGWKEQIVAVDEVLANAWEELRKDKPNPGVFIFNFIIACVWGEDFGGHFQKLDNDLLGMKQLSDDELQAIVGRYS
ncbi:MAG: hypothetical protein Q9191_002733 [Dirinaria sp. TL-2023a]